MDIWEYPVVPEEPETLKLSESVAELNAKLETVEFDSTEKTFWFWLSDGVRAKFTVWVTPE